MLNISEHNLGKLKVGCIFWNNYRITFDDQGYKIDLSNSLISGDNWRFNEIKNAELHNCNFKNTEFRDIDFIDIDFSNSDFSNARFSNVHFTKCHFLGNSFKNAEFKDTSWYYISMEDITFPELKNFDNILFYKCSFNKDIFKGMDMPGPKFEECNFNLKE